MVLAALQSAVQLLLLSLSAFVIFMTLRRSWRRNRAKVKTTSAPAEQCDPLERTREINTSYIHDMQLRLYDYSRDVEGRLQTTLETLDQLVDEAGREIERLDTLLETGKKQKPRRVPDVVCYDDPSESLKMPSELAKGPLNDDRMIVLLCDAGYSPEDIADYMDRSLAEVLVILESQFRRGSNAA